MNRAMDSFYFAIIDAVKDMLELYIKTFAERIIWHNDNYLR